MLESCVAEKRRYDAFLQVFMHVHMSLGNNDASLIIFVASPWWRARAANMARREN